MAKYRQIRTEFWSDTFILDLTPEEKYFYLYLMTNAKTSQCGIYELPIQIMSIEIGYDKETIKELIERFTGYKKIIYSHDTKEIMILNWMKYNAPRNINSVKCVNKELKEVKNNLMIKVIYEQCKMLDLDMENIFKDIHIQKEKTISLLQAPYEGLTRGLVEVDYEEVQNKKLEINEIQYNDKETKLKSSNTNEQTNIFNINGDYSKGLISPLQGDSKPLPSNKVISNKEEIINKKEEVISKEEEAKSNNTSTSSGINFQIVNENAEEDDKYKILNDKGFSKVIDVFNNNIHPVSPIEYEGLRDWSKEVDCEVIILAIKEAVNYSARTMKYINGILVNWTSKGITTVDGVMGEKRKWEDKRKAVAQKKEKSSSFCNFEQRQYDCDKLEKQLLGIDN